MIKRNGKVFSDDLWEKAKIKDKFNYALVISISAFKRQFIRNQLLIQFVNVQNIL